MHAKSREEYREKGGRVKRGRRENVKWKGLTTAMRDEKVGHGEP